jgi:hypothetical protein
MIPYLIGVFTGIIIALIIAFAIQVSRDSIENIETKFDAADAEKLAFLDMNLLDSVYNRATNSWGIVTQDKRFLATGPTLHEAIGSAQTVLAAVVPFKG